MYENNNNYGGYGGERPRWDRATLKDYAKSALKNFYWKAVLASLIFSVLTGGFNTGSSSSGVTLEQEMGSINDVPYSVGDFLFPGNNIDTAVLGIASLLILIAALIGLAIGLVYSAFVAGPLEVGHNRFYMESRFNPTGIGKLFHGFSCGNYRNVVKTLFLRDLYVILWSLLFIVPGIIKGLQYSMVPYILAENPDISTERAFELSKQMTDGRKWDLFVLHLSFFGWNLLASLVIIGGIFLNPYINATYSEVYLWLRYDALANGYATSQELNGMFMNPPEYTQY